MPASMQFLVEFDAVEVLPVDAVARILRAKVGPRTGRRSIQTGDAPLGRPADALSCFRLARRRFARTFLPAFVALVCSDAAAVAWAARFPARLAETVLVPLPVAFVVVPAARASAVLRRLVAAVPRTPPRRNAPKPAASALLAPVAVPARALAPVPVRG